ncbi:hypothetical protein BH09PSE1_BH09PSE1_12400 [soil metagenome]
MDYGDFEDAEIMAAIRSDPNNADSQPEMVEVVSRAARRLAHAIDPTFAIEPTEPFDLTAEVDAIRELAVTVTPGLGDEKSLLMFLHREPDGDGPFDREIWLELMAVVRPKARATDNAAAMAYALFTALKHAMTQSQLVTALRQARGDWVTSGASTDGVDLNLSTVRDRRFQAISHARGVGFFLEEYHGDTEFEPDPAAG